MAYNTNTYFILFLPLALLSYQLTPRKHRWLILLLSSVVFFSLISGHLIAWAALTAVITYFGALLLEQCPAGSRKRKWTLRTAVLFVTAILAVLKYTNFTIRIINSIFFDASAGPGLSPVKILVPIGISFYTMQALGYMIDVYWNRMRAEKNFLKLFLFLIFFPTLMEGPILRWSDVNSQLFEGEPLNGENMTQGLVRIVWGLFKRMLISDRLYAAVNVMYMPSTDLSGIMVLFCMLITTLQLYIEFSGTIDIIIGSAKMFNITLPENFRQPFFAKSAAEFWRRWHISLGTWFKNYIFYPVTTSDAIKKWNKYGRKRFGKYLTVVVTSAAALFPVWILNGLWHGPQTTYIMYGVYYFLILFLEVMLGPAAEKLYAKAGLSVNGKIVSGFRLIRTWCVILVGEMLFRAKTMEQFFTLMKDMFSSPWDGGALSGKLGEISMDMGDYLISFIGILIVFFVDAQMERDPQFIRNIPSLPLAKRWLIYYCVIMAIVIFGAYGEGYDPAALIYAGF